MATALFAAALLVWQVDLGWASAGWSLRPQPSHPWNPGFLLAPLLVGGFAAAAVWSAARRPAAPRWHVALVVTVLMVAHVLLSVLLDGGPGPRAWLTTAVGSTWSEVSNGYFAEATKITDVGAWLATYDQVQAASQGKISTHPPGAVLVYWLGLRLWSTSRLVRGSADRLLIAVSEGNLYGLQSAVLRLPTVPYLGLEHLSSALWCVLFVAGLGALTVVPVYLLGARLDSPRAGLFAAGLFSLMPSSLLYMLSLDVVIMMLTAWAALGAVCGLRGGRRGLWAAAGGGLALGSAVAISLGALASVALVIACLVLVARAEAVEPRRIQLVLAALAGGLVLVVALGALAGVPVFTVVQQGLAAHRGGAAGTGHRPYLPWVLWNLVDYALLVGLPVVLVALAGLRRPRSWAPVAAVLLTLALLSLSGIVKAETERLWIFANPLLAAAAGVVVAGQAAWWSVLASQPVWLSVVALGLTPLVRPW